MIVTRLELTNLRVIEDAQLHFQPGMNLIVGVNGVGKTTVLDALRVCLSGIVNQVNALQCGAEEFTLEDIRSGAGPLTAECEFRIGGQQYCYGVSKPRVIDVEPSRALGEPDVIVDEASKPTGFRHDAPPRANGGEPGGRPMAVLYSTRRSVPSREPAEIDSEVGIAGAYADALADRELRLGEIARWLKVQDTTRNESVDGALIVNACEDAVRRFLPEYSFLHVLKGHHPQPWVERMWQRIPVRLLSEGERGSLAMVLDLTRRLALANPQMQSPATEAEAVVLIDEIDLHLHPKWQRQIVHNLTEVFPRCQFIATTHSPQVIGEVPHHRIQVIEHGRVYSPMHSLGVDSSRVLEEIMDTPPRAQEIQGLLDRISRMIGKRQFDQGYKLVGDLADRIGAGDAEVIRLRTLLDFLEEK